MVLYGALFVSLLFYSTTIVNAVRSHWAPTLDGWTAKVKR